MASTIAAVGIAGGGVNPSTPRDSPKAGAMKLLKSPWKRVTAGSGSMRVRAAPEGISEKVEKSIKSAEETCEENPASGECVAAWDEVEELSAAASHARDRIKDSDPLEAYCKDNPETDECRTYED